MTGIVSSCLLSSRHSPFYSMRSIHHIDNIHVLAQVHIPVICPVPITSEKTKIAEIEKLAAWQVTWAGIRPVLMPISQMSWSHHHHHHHHHSLNGSQTVLTATFNSYGDRQISTPTKSIPLNQSTKNSAQLIMSARGLSIPNLVQIHPLTASGQKLFLYLFSQARAQVRFVDGFLHAIAQKT